MHDQERQLTRAECAEAGITTYVGGPCRRCRGRIRYVSNADCINCARERVKRCNGNIRKLLAEAKAAKAIKKGQ